MPDGDMRRPPLLWEQRLARRVTALGPGVSSSAATNVVEDFATSTGYDEPDDTITTLGTPSTPTVTGSLRMVVVAWDGLDTDGDAYNGENQWVDVHLGGSATFTPGTATVRGQLYEAGRLTIGDLDADTTYYAKLVGKDSEGNTSTASAAGSATTGLILSTDIGTGQITAGLVSFDATAIGGIEQFVGTATPSTSGAEGSTWINTADGAYYTLTGGSWVKRQWDTDAIAVGAINTLQIATGAITAESGIIANAAIGSAQLGTAIITDANIASLNADKITAGTLTGRVVRTSGGSNRVELADSGVNTGDSIGFYYGGTRVAGLYGFPISGVNYFLVSGNIGTFNNIASAGTISGATVNSDGALASQTLDVSGAGVDMLGVYNNNTTGLDNVGINTSGRLRRLSSSQEIKYDMATLAGSLSPSVDADRQLGEATVDPRDVLDLAVTEFSVVDAEITEAPSDENGPFDFIANGTAAPRTPTVEPIPTERRVLGFIADDVADKFPIAATADDTGKPSGVLDTAILAALLAVVKDQADTISDLTARIEALEA